MTIALLKCSVKYARILSFVHIERDRERGRERERKGTERDGERTGENYWWRENKVRYSRKGGRKVSLDSQRQRS